MSSLEVLVKTFWFYTIFLFHRILIIFPIILGHRVIQIPFSGVKIYSELYAWVAVFMLPINSALNPVLYTLTTKLFKQQLARIVYTWRAGGVVQIECPAESSGISMTSAPYNGRWSKNNSASITTSDVRVFVFLSIVCKGDKMLG